MARKLKPGRQQRSLPLRRLSTRTTADNLQREHERNELESLFLAGSSPATASHPATVLHLPAAAVPARAARPDPTARARAKVPFSRIEIVIALASIAFAAGGLTLFVRGASVSSTPGQKRVPAHDTPPSPRFETVGAIPRASLPADLAHRLETLQKAPRWSERQRAAQELAAQPRPEAVAALVASLANDPDWAVRAACADALGDLHAGHATLEKAAEQDRERAVRDAAALALRSFASSVPPPTGP